MIVPDRVCVLEPVELLDGVTLGLCDGVTEGVDVGEAPFDSVAVCEAVSLGVSDDVSLFVGVTDDERVGLFDGVPLRVVLPVTVPEREPVSEGV